jgi:hypothetical protein
MTSSAGRRSLFGAAPISLALAVCALGATAASAHDIWINKERRTNAAGEWCCNTYDCAAVPEEKIKVTPRGYVLESGETIPHSNAAMSGDGQYWQCRRPDKSTRCFFFPPPGT